MNPKDRIARLEALLARVNGRKLDPRELAKALEAPSDEVDALLAREIDAQAAEVAAAHSRELAAESARELSAEELDPDDLTLDEPDIEPGWSIPVARPEVPHAAANGAEKDAIAAAPPDELLADFPSEPMLLIGDDATSLDDYEVAETVELDGDGDDDAIRHSNPPASITPSNPPEENLLESRQRLVSAAPAADFDEEDDEPRSIPLVQRRPSQIPADFAELSEPGSVTSTRRGEELDLPMHGEVSHPRPTMQEPEELGELELIPDPPRDDEAPPSSRRPIAQQLSDLDDFEEDLAPPPVTAPPESGKQITAAQESSLAFEEDFTGVRDDARAEEFVGGAMPMLEALPMDGMAIALEPVSATAVAEQDAMEMVLPAAQAPGEFARSFDGQPPSSGDFAAFPPAEHTRPGLAPETVNPDLISTSRVAVHEGLPPSFRPGSFGELLDAALSL